MIESADDLRRVMHYVDATELNEGDFLEVSVQVLRALEAEATALAANQCHDGYAGEYGHHRCRYQDRIAELEEANARLRAALEEIVSPLKFMAERAKADGRHLSGMAYKIANDPNHLQGIARAALEPARAGD